jgi:hypothetical protein
MKRALICAAALVAMTVGASAQGVSQREYRRGYNDCAAGRYDQNQHGESYKRGCRAAEDKKAAGGAAAPAATAAAPEGAMLAACRARAARAYRARMPDVDVKYEGQRVDGTHAVNGTVASGATFQCSFNKAGRRIVRFVRN